LNILFSISHPAHVHFFRHAISILRSQRHKVVVAARDKDITLDLLDNYEIKHEVLTKKKSGIPGVISEFFVYQYLLSKILRANKIDLVLSIGAALNAHICYILGIPCFQFCDTETQWRQNNLTYPFVTKLFTPSCYNGDIGSKHIRYEGYHELAYLHPNRFQPDSAVLEHIKVDSGEKYVIMRFVSWQATHDVGHSGLSLKIKREAVREFSKYAKVFITSEATLPDDLEQYKITIPPERIHDALYFATLFYGESATMASESSVLGTPSIFLDNEGRGYTDEQEKKYGLVFNFSESINDQKKSIEKGVELINNNSLNEIWHERKERMISDKIDVTQYLINIVKSSVVNNDKNFFSY